MYSSKTDTMSALHPILLSQSPNRYQRKLLELTRTRQGHLGQHHRISITISGNRTLISLVITHRSVSGTSTLLVLTGVVSSSVLSVTTSGSLVGTVTTGSATEASWSTGRSGGLHVGLRNDLRREVEELSEVGETLVGEGVVVPLPRELGLDVALGGQGLHGLDDLEVSDRGDRWVGWLVEVLGGDKDTLFEESLVDLGRVSARLHVFPRASSPSCLPSSSIPCFSAI